MDVWIVAAAAGAGYVAQHFKNLKARKHNSSDLLSENLNHGAEISKQRKHACYDASTSGFEGENLVQVGNLSSGGMVSDLDSLAGLFNTDKVSPSDSASQPSVSSREIGYSYCLRRDRSRLKSRQINSKFIKPQTSLESCLMAQLYKEHAEIGEYDYSFNPSRKPIARPFIVTDGSKIISRAPHQSKDTHSQDNKIFYCVPRVPSDVAVELETEAKTKTGKKQVLVRSNSRKVDNENQSNAQGISDGNILFLLGLTVGMSYSFSGHKRDIERLKKSVKQTENLVQDLQDELEMKDVLTVKELSIEDYESPVHQDFDHAIQMLSLEQKLNCSSMYCNGGNSDQITKDESLKKIEAELEVELDKLHLNMNSSSKLEGKLSDVAELDPDSVSYAIKGELRSDLFGAEKQAYTDREESCFSTPRSRYPVSPRELSLRLHEVIQSRLEERVKELETELEYNERKFNCMESEHIHPWGDFSGHESPNATDDPIVIKLSGEALAAYNEVYDELTKLSESDEEESNHEEVFHRNKLDLDNGCLDSYMKQLCLSSDGSLETELDHRDEEGVDDTVLNDGESEDGEDEMERLLIRQIVEKAKQGSPAVLRAQRAFLSIHEN